MQGRGERLTGQPTAIAGDTLRVIMDIGKFQGVMAATTPTGCLITTGRLVADTVCRTSPLTLLHSSANHSMEATLQAAHQGTLDLSFAYSILGLDGLVYHFASHQIDAERRRLFFSFLFWHSGV